MLQQQREPPHREHPPPPGMGILLPGLAGTPHLNP